VSAAGPLTFGVYVPQFKTDVSSMVTLATSAEEASFGSFWVMDHLLTPGAPPCDTLESWTLLTAITCATDRIRLGHLVGCAPFRHPALLAKMAATFDQVSRGRLELGLGWGSVESELTAYGFDTGSRRQRSQALGETLEILDLMFAGTPFDYAGEHFTLQGAYGLPRPVQGRIPIHIGGGGPQLTMPLVRRHADWWNCVGSARERFDQLAPLRGRARISAQYAVGAITDESDRERVNASATRRLPSAAWGEVLIGNADELIARFTQERERGVELAILRFHDTTPEMLAWFGSHVAGPLRALPR